MDNKEFNFTSTFCFLLLGWEVCETKFNNLKFARKQHFLYGIFWTMRKSNCIELMFLMLLMISRMTHIHNPFSMNCKTRNKCMFVWFYWFIIFRNENYRHVELIICSRLQDNHSNSFIIYSDILTNRKFFLANCRQKNTMAY